VFSVVVLSYDDVNLRFDICCSEAVAFTTKRTEPVLCLARSANLPEGLSILLALISFFFFLIEQSYLRIYWTDFHDLFTKWKVFV